MNALDKLLDAADYLEQAEEEITELLLSGKQVDRFTFADLLDCELDNGTRAIAGDLSQHLCDILDFARDEHVHGERRACLREWMLGLVERFLDSHPELISRRAREIARAALEPEYEPSTD